MKDYIITFYHQRTEFWDWCTDNDIHVEYMGPRYQFEIPENEDLWWIPDSKQRIFARLKWE